MSVSTDQRSLGEMFAQLSRDTRTLVEQELQLARVELMEKASSMGRSAGFIAGGGLLAYAGFLGIVAALVLGLVALGMPAWLASLLGGACVAGTGGLLVRAGLAQVRSQALKPQQTLETLKEDVEWLRTQMKPARFAPGSKSPGPT